LFSVFFSNRKSAVPAGAAAQKRAVYGKKV
jgi:hypothetical protein